MAIVCLEKLSGQKNTEEGNSNASLLTFCDQLLWPGTMLGLMESSRLSASTESQKLVGGAINYYHHPVLLILLLVFRVSHTQH